MRVWIHCKYSIGSKKLVFSPDTDTYHVGMGLLEDARMSDYEIYVKLSRLGEAEKFLHLSVLNEALQSDQNLAVVPPSVKVKALQMLYITSGCDYVSFFYNIGKARLLQCFFQHAPFITSGSTYIGTLADVSPQSESYGYLVLMRLVGVAYFKQHTRAFQHRTPEALFNSVSQNNFCEPTTIKDTTCEMVR